MMKCTAVPLGLSVALMFTACDSPGRVPAPYSTRQTNAPRDLLLESAEFVLVELGYEIAERDVADGVLSTRPVEDRGGGLRAGDGVISSASPTRRVVNVRVESGPQGSRVFCKASVQAQVSTAAAQMLQGARSTDDGIGQTAIDRDAATTIEQNTYWRTVSRDRTLERRILEAIQERVATSQAP